MKQNPRALVDTLYAKYQEDLSDTFEDEVRKRCPLWIVFLVGKIGLIRGFFLFWIGRQYPIIITAADASGAWTALFIDSLIGNLDRRFILFEFIRKRPDGWLKIIYPLYLALILKPAVRKKMKIGQVLTFWEVDHYARMFEVPRNRFVFLPYPMYSRNDVPPKFNATSEKPFVLCSGRVSCDWETLFRATEDAQWSLTVVCTQKQLRRVSRLNHNGRVRILCDISGEDHFTLLKKATIYVICMTENIASSGQVRLANAIRAGVPVVATRILGLEGYIVQGETGILVEPGDWEGLRDAIEFMLQHPDKRQQFRSQAFKKAAKWTREDYFDSLRNMVKTVLENINSE